MSYDSATYCREHGPFDADVGCLRCAIARDLLSDDPVAFDAIAALTTTGEAEEVPLYTGIRNAGRRDIAHDCRGTFLPVGFPAETLAAYANKGLPLQGAVPLRSAQIRAYFERARPTWRPDVKRNPKRRGAR